MKTFLGLLAIVVAIYAYIPYFRDIASGKTKPHAFTWFVWCLLTGIAFFAQLNGHAKAGAWVTGFTTIISFIIFVLALKVGRKNITIIDWFFLVGALLSLILWAVTSNPVTAVILITIIDALAFAPTFRKSFYKPYEETAVTYTLSGIKFAISIAALATFSVTTILYPLSLVITNGLFVVLLLVRRRILESKTKTENPLFP